MLFAHQRRFARQHGIAAVAWMVQRVVEDRVTFAKPGQVVVRVGADAQCRALKVPATRSMKRSTRSRATARIKGPTTVRGSTGSPITNMPAIACMAAI